MRNDTNSIPKRNVAPRISVIAAIDTNGTVYFTLTQINTDENVFALFLKRLFDKLSTEDRSWKENTVLLFDSASYHSADMVRNFICKSKVKAVLSAPYAYDGAPIEMFFHLLKRTNLNPNKLPTGKR